jgi:hypothetical protein
MKKGTKVSFDDKRHRIELLRIADDLRALQRRARAARAALEQTADFRRARGLARKGDDKGACSSLAWFWSGGLGSVILSIGLEERACRADARVTARTVARRARALRVPNTTGG